MINTLGGLEASPSSINTSIARVKDTIVTAASVVTMTKGLMSSHVDERHLLLIVTMSINSSSY
jgi:hypothetical protein